MRKHGFMKNKLLILIVFLQVFELTAGNKRKLPVLSVKDSLIPLWRNNINDKFEFRYKHEIQKLPALMDHFKLFTYGMLNPKMRPILKMIIKDKKNPWITLLMRNNAFLLMAFVGDEKDAEWIESFIVSDMIRNHQKMKRWWIDPDEEDNLNYLTGMAQSFGAFNGAYGSRTASYEYGRSWLTMSNWNQYRRYWKERMKMPLSDELLNQMFTRYTMALSAYTDDTESLNMCLENKKYFKDQRHFLIRKKWQEGRPYSKYNHLMRGWGTAKLMVQYRKRYSKRIQKLIDMKKTIEVLADFDSSK